jgi:hypothetical protein
VRGSAIFGRLRIGYRDDPVVDLVAEPGSENGLDIANDLLRRSPSAGLDVDLADLFALHLHADAVDITQFAKRGLGPVDPAGA